MSGIVPGKATAERYPMVEPASGRAASAENVPAVPLPMATIFIPAPTPTGGRSPSPASSSGSGTRSGEGNGKNWFYDTAIAAIGGFIGFGFALLLQQLLVIRQRKKCIVNIVLELNDMRKRIENKKDERKIPSTLSYGLATPIWETVVSNGNILELKKEPYYDVLFTVYNSISKLSRLEDRTREDVPQDLDELLGMRRAVLELFGAEPLKSLTGTH
jgi:hypothetical protein